MTEGNESDSERRYQIEKLKAETKKIECETEALSAESRQKWHSPRNLLKTAVTAVLSIIAFWQVALPFLETDSEIHDRQVEIQALKNEKERFLLEREKDSLKSRNAEISMARAALALLYDSLEIRLGEAIRNVKDCSEDNKKRILELSAANRHLREDKRALLDIQDLGESDFDGGPRKSILIMQKPAAVGMAQTLKKSLERLRVKVDVEESGATGPVGKVMIWYANPDDQRIARFIRSKLSSDLPVELIQDATILWDIRIGF